MDSIDSLYDIACSHAVLFDLSANAKVELAGPEAVTFLNNLCTNDVKNLPVGYGCEAFLTTAKARVVGHIFVNHGRWNGQPLLWLDSMPGQAEKLAAHLNHFIISEQVEVADRTAEWALHRLVGPASQSILESYFHLSLAGWKHLQGQEVNFSEEAVGWLRRFDCLSLPAFDVFAPRAAARWAAMLKLVDAPLPVHEILRVEAGLPAFGADIDEIRLVMEVGRVPQAICYTKGCFLGQEPIVMARDRGQVNRTLVGVVVNAGEPLPPGCRLFKDDKEVGQVTSSVRSPRLGKVIALAYLKRGFQEPGTELVVEPANDDRTAVAAGLPLL